VRMKKTAALLAVFGALTSAKVYYSEDFGNGWENRWVKSTSKESEGTQGEWAVDGGLKTTQDARFYQISSEFPEFSNTGKDLIVQYSVKHGQKLDCGGGYIKIMPKGVDQGNFGGDSPYNIMFGPDICGSSTRKTHLIFNYKGTNHLIKKEIRCETDEFTHLYTLTVHPDNTYRVDIDGKEVASGSLKEDWDMLAPKEIKGPKASKPADWVDNKMMADPTDVKPEGWDDIPRQIRDPDASKPEDWDDELDGEWEAPQIDNPDYKGEWRAKQIENPDYKGEWVHPLVPNPDYQDDDSLYQYTSNKYVGFELWQVKSGSTFGNILVTDSEEDAKAAAEKVEKLREEEKAEAEKAENERKAKEEEERKAREAEEANKADTEDDHAGHDHKDEL